jgi:hypothetical protein
MWDVSMQSNDLLIDATAGLFSILDKKAATIFDSSQSRVEN